LAINTIDGGKMDDPLHDTSAVIFFILFWIDMILVTWAYYQLRKYNPEIISCTSLVVKFVIVLLSISLIVEVGAYIINPNKANIDPATPILEWGALLFLCAFFYSFASDWKNFYYALDVPTSQ
jgi:hypothetical protein